MTPWTQAFADVVVAFLAFAVLLAIIVALAVPVTERHERRKAMHRGTHPAGKHRAKR